MQNNGGISLRIKSGYSVTVGGLNNYGGLIYIEPGASLIILGNDTISNNGSAGIIADGSLVVKGSLSVQGGNGISGTGTLTTPNPITLQNNGGATVFGQTYASTGGTISCSSGSPCNLSTNTVCSGVTVAIGTDQSICSGTTPTQLSTVSGTTITGAVTYQWVQYSASTNSYQNVSSGGTGATYSPVALTQQTFYKLKVTKSTCTTYSSAVTITVSSPPAISNANITGTTSFCAGTTGLVYTVNGITGASSYSWTFPSGFTVVTTNGNLATVNTSGSAVSGQISVSGVNACGTSIAVATSVSVNSIPSAPSAISGSNLFCFLGSSNVYSVPTVTGVLSYIWTVPTGTFQYTVSSPNNVNLVTVTSGALSGSGNISVSGVNACGTGSAASIAISVAIGTLSSGTIMGNTTICQGSMAVYTASGAVLATNYTWSVPTGFSMISQNGTSSTLMTISISGTTTGTISVIGSSSCGTATASTLSVSVNSTIAGTGAIIGSNSLCQSSSSTYILSGLSSVSTFNWFVPSGFTISSGQGTSVIGVNISSIAGTGSISISGINTCGTSNAVIQSITINSTPTGTGAISGTNPVCLGASFYSYTVTGLTSASTYNWTIPAGFTIMSGQTTSILGFTVASSALGGNMSISGSNVCGSGLNSMLVITTNTTPTGTGAIIGSSPVCQSSSANYTVTGISNLSSFDWTVPSGFTISSGQGSSVIGVTFSSSASTGNLSISGSNTCGNGNQSTLSVTVNATPSGSGAIAGTTSLCQGISGNYTLTGISNASSFNWSVPSGFTINSGQGTSILVVTFAANASNGSISISGSNTCGPGLLANQAISVVTVPSNPLTISGSLTVCQGQTGVIYNATVTNASSFNWGLPSGASITAGTGTSSIAVTYSSSVVSGILTVQGVNGICIGNTSSAYNVTVNSLISSNTLAGFANTICWNTAPLTTLSGTTAIGGTGSYTYLWESSTVSGAAGFNSATGINTNATYIPDVLGATTWYKRIVNSGSCSANTSSGVSINVISLTGSWIGMNSDWNNSINWCLGTVPGSVFIDAGRPYYPIITASGISISDLTIASGASLTLNSPSYLTVSGNFLNSGTFNASTGTGTVFNGASIQSITGTNTFYDLTLAKSSVSAPVLLAGNTSLKGTLTLSANSELVTTGYSFVLLSSINETARIASIPVTSTIVGNITMQRYIPAKLSFRFLSSAVSGSTLNAWKGNMLITGNGSGSDAGSSLPVVYQYNEPLPGNQNIGFQSITSGTSTPLQAGKGYRVLVRGDRSINLVSNYAATITTLSVCGVPNMGPTSLPVTYTSTTGGNVSTDGWNLVGNPYASQIDWNLITVGGVNFQHIDNAIYILDPMSASLTTAGQYLSYVNGVAAGPGATNANPNYISSSQAFFVHANAANPVLKLDENVKVSNTANNHFRVEEIANLLRIAISGSKGDEDNSVIRFTEGATQNFDSVFDAYKLSNTGPSVASTPYTGLYLSINSMQPLDTASRTITLNISTPVNGDHLLKFTSVSTFGSLVRIMLVDKYLNSTADIEEGFTYAFITSTLAGTKGTSRFDVVFTPQLGSAKANISPDSLTLVNSNAKWKLDTSWYNSNETANYIPAGIHTISFATVPGWITPDPKQVVVSTNTLVTFLGVYLPFPKIGSVHVKLIPESLEKGKVRTEWRINSGAWHNSSISSLDSLPIGNYTISFSELNGWVKPQEITVLIQDGQETSITGEFLQTPDTSITFIEQSEDAVETDISSINTNESSNTTAVTGITGNATIGLFEINTYPNPVGADAPVVSIKGLNGSNFKLTVYNQSGVSLYSKVFSQRDLKTTFQTRLEIFKELPDGLYLIQLMQEGRTLVKKIRK
jgi:hypothetical protein